MSCFEAQNMTKATLNCLATGTIEITKNCAYVPNVYRMSLHQLNWTMKKRKQQRKKDLCSDEVRTATLQSLKENSLTLCGWMTACMSLRPVFALVFSFTWKYPAIPAYQRMLVGSHNLTLGDLSPGCLNKSSSCPKWSVCCWGPLYPHQLRYMWLFACNYSAAFPRTRLHSTRYLPLSRISTSQNTLLLPFLRQKHSCLCFFKASFLRPSASPSCVSCVCVWVVLNNTHLVRGGAGD